MTDAEIFVALETPEHRRLYAEYETAELASRAHWREIENALTARDRHIRRIENAGMRLRLAWQVDRDEPSDASRLEVTNAQSDYDASVAIPLPSVPTDRRAELEMVAGRARRAIAMVLMGPAS